MTALERNLQEIHTAAHSPNCEVVADPTGTYIYSTNAGWGIVWSWVYKIAEFLGINHFRKNCFERAMTNTHRLFSEQLSQVIDSCESYEANLRKRYLGEKICDRENALHRQRISHWYRSVSPFIHYTKSEHSRFLKHIISTNFTQEFSPKYTTPLSEGSFSSMIKRQRRIIKLEGVLKVNLPVDLLIKAASKTVLKRSEKESLKKFVRKINNHQSDIGVKNLHHALLNVINKVKEFELDAPIKTAPNITTLEMELLKIDCPLLLQKDQKHISRREYKPGETINCNLRLLTIGERLGAIRENDQNVVYTTDDPNVVAVIGINSVIHPLKRLLAGTDEWGIRSADYIDIDHKNGVALVERLYDHLGNFAWTSNSEVITREDEDVAMPLWRLLSWFVEKNSTPINFSPKYLMFDSKGILKCLKVTTRGEFDFNALVKFALESSAGNIHIYRYLMQQSKLITHKYARYYEDVVIQALREEKGSAGNLATSRGIVDHRIIASGKTFEKEVLKLKECCKKEIKPEGILTNPKVMNQKINEQFIASYQRSAAAGTLPDYLAQEIIKNVSLKNRGSN